MTRIDDIAILVLAAGTASRFGSPKQLADIGGVPMVRHAAQIALKVTPQVVVVTGAHVGEVNAALKGLDLTIVHNAAWAAGMGGSIAAGVRAAVERLPNVRAIVVMLGDQPLVSDGDLRQLVVAQDNDEDIIAASAHGVVGPPCLFPRRDFDELMALDGTEGARRLLRVHASRVRTVDMPNAAVDIDTPNDLESVDPSFLRAKD